MGRIICTYNITVANESIKILNATGGVDNIYYNGNSIGVVQYYTFPTTGLHRLEFEESGIVRVGFANLDALVEVEIIGNEADLYTSVQEQLFYGCANLKKVTLPNNLKYIYTASFYNCKSLQTITIPSSTEKIYTSAFFGSGLEELIIEGCPNIELSAFAETNKLKTITCYSTTPPVITNTTFKLIAPNGTLNYPEGADYSSWLSTDGWYLGYYGWNTDNSSLLKCYYVWDGDGEVELFNETLTDYVNLIRIGTDTLTQEDGDLSNWYANWDWYDEESGYLVAYIRLNDMTTIPDYFFRYNAKLAKFEIPESITSLGKDVFYDTDKLNTIVCYSTTPPVINESSYGNTFRFINRNGTLYYPEGADYSSWLSTEQDYLGYYGWNGVEIEVDEPEVTTPYVTGTTTILYFNYDGTPKTSNEFDVYWYGDYYDRNIVNDSSHFGVSGRKIETTDEYVKYHYTVVCTPNNTNEIITGSCYFNIKLDASTYGESFVVEFRQDAKPESDTGDTPTVTNTLVCTYNVTDTTSATKLCENVSNFTDIIVNGVSIGLETEYRFSTTGEHTVEFVLEDKTIIGDSAFMDCINLRTVNIPDSVTTINYRAFIWCSSLASIVIPDSVITIGEEAFKWCEGLTSVTMGSSVTTIDIDAFYGCSSLTSIVIPDSVTTIGEEAFMWCEGLTSLTIGSGVTTIERYAFEYCESLNEIISYARTQPDIHFQTFLNVATDGTLYYPEGSDYSTWLSKDANYLGYYGWNGIEMDEEPDIPIEPDDSVKLELEYGQIQAPQGGLNTTLDVTTQNVSEVTVASPKWVKVTEKDGYYEIEVLPNEDGVDRTGEAYFIGNPTQETRVEQNIIINQNSDNSEMAASISLDRSRVTFDKTGYAENFGVKVTYTNAKEIYTPECDADWVTITKLLPQQGGNTSNSTNSTSNRYGISVTETVKTRTAIVTFSCLGENDRLISNSSFLVEQIGETSDEPEEPKVLIKAFIENGTVNYDGSSTGIGITSLGCSYKNATTILEPTVSASWIHLGEGVQQSSLSEDTVVYRYPITFDTNTSVQRVGIVTFMATDAQGNEYTSTTTITQLAAPVTPDEPEPELPEDSDEITYSPIWKDIEYTFVNDEEYGIYTEKSYRYNGVSYKEDVLLFKGRAYIAPNSDRVNININKICQNYMSEAPNIFTDAVGYYHSYNEFKLKNSYGTLLHTYRFVNDWSYDTLTLGLKSNPIVPHIGDGQKLFFSAFATDRKEFKWGMRYYDGTADYDNMEVLTDDFETVVVAPSREDGVNTFYFGDKSFTVLPRCRCKYVLYYMNPYGGYDWFPITGRVTRKDKIETFVYTKNYNNTTVDFGKNRYLANISITYNLNTGWLTQEQSDRMWEVLESNTVWLHNLEEDKIYPVVITDTNIEHKQKFGKKRRLSYSINVELSHTRERV